MPILSLGSNPFTRRKFIGGATAATGFALYGMRLNVFANESCSGTTDFTLDNATSSFLRTTPGSITEAKMKGKFAVRNNRTCCDCVGFGFIKAYQRLQGQWSAVVGGIKEGGSLTIPPGQTATVDLDWWSILSVVNPNAEAITVTAFWHETSPSAGDVVVGAEEQN